MAEFKLSELNSINEIRSDDLLHVRVKKRTEMLGDEDRRMTYADFLASFKLERFLQLTGGTMTGNIGIIKLQYNGRDVFDPTGSELIVGDVQKTAKINANGLKLSVADSSRSATVYHTLNKPSPNELGMRSNDENDARFAIKGTANTFSGSQTIQANVAGLTLKNTSAAALYYEGRDQANAVRFTVGNLSDGSDVSLVNTKSGSSIILATNTVGINKTLLVTGQVQPSDFANFDARFYTQNAADQRFVQLAAANTLTGNNTYRGSTTLLGDGARLTLKNLTSGKALYIEGQNTDASMKWAVGNYADGSNSVVLTNISQDTYILLDTAVRFNKNVVVTGQVQPSDWANIDSRYIPASVLSNLAKLNATNTFTSNIVVRSNTNAITLKNSDTSTGLYILGQKSDGTNKFYIGTDTSDAVLNVYNYVSGSQISLADTISANKTLKINGQVQPSDLGNFDSRYYTQSTANSRYMLAGSSGTATEDNADGVAWNAKTGLYNVTVSGGGSTQLVYQMYQGASSTPSVQLKFNYRNGGMWYRSARDSFGFEAGWAKVYTDASKPTPSEIGAYTKAEVDQKISSAVTDSTDLKKVYPVGIVTWFSTNQNPNTTLPGMTWTYLNNGVGRTIRVAAANGSDIGTTGGGDSKTLAVGNLPSHTHSFSATTSSFDYGTKNTNSTGAHTHTISGTAASAGNHTHNLKTGRNDSFDYHGAGNQRGHVGNGYTAGYDAGNSWIVAAGAHTHSVSGSAASAGAHTHSVGIGAHTHTVSGTTGGTGSGSAFDVTNSFIKLMAWVRTA